MFYAAVYRRLKCETMCLHCCDSKHLLLFYYSEEEQVNHVACIVAAHKVEESWFSKNLAH